MSVEVSNWMQTQYVNRVMHIYQTEGNKLRPTVTMATRFEGSEKAVFWLAGKTKARKKKRGERNIVGNAPRKKFEVPLETWVAFDAVEEYDEDRMGVNEREVIYTAGANALGVATDVEIYDKAHAGVDAKVGAGAFTPGMDFSAGAFNAAQAMTLCMALQTQKVKWDGMVYCGLPALQWNQLLANKVVNSAEHVGPNNLPFVQATDSRFWNGVNWFLFEEDEPEDLYQVNAANTQDLLIWHKTGMGWGHHTDLRLKTQYDIRTDEMLFNMQAKGAATTLQEGNGIVRFRTSTTDPIAIV